MSATLASLDAGLIAHLEESGFTPAPYDAWCSLQEFAWNKAEILDERTKISLPRDLGTLLRIQQNALIVQPAYVKLLGYISAKRNHTFDPRMGGVLVLGRHWCISFSSRILGLHG